MTDEINGRMEETKQKLLIVDDDPMNLDMLARRLERQGYAVGTASSGREALIYINKHPLDLVLLDHNMPDMSGLEVLQSIRRTQGPSDLPVIMVTAVSEANTIVTALNLGANDYITKPVDLAVAVARINAQLTRRAAERDLRDADQRDVSAARAGNDGFWEWNLETNEMYYSPRWKAMLGLADEEVENSPAEWFSRIHPDDSNRVQQDLEAAISGTREVFDSEHRLQHKDGTWRWVLSRGKASLNDCGKPSRLAGTQTDVTESKTADPLTNLPNRLLFTDRIRTAILRSAEQRGSTFAVLLLDVDRFKVINDSLGHLIGDELLVGVARRLREIDKILPAIVGRLGGDEFGILIDCTSCSENAAEVARWVAQTLAPPFLLEGREVYCSLSIGIALGPGDARQPEDILRDADTAMYRAKALGGDRFEMFDGEMRRRAIARLELEADMRRALSEQQFELYYQPKVDLSDGSVMGFEALVRWQHPSRGLLQPEDFIPLAEETGLIVPLGAWIFEQACRQLRQWQTEFARTPALTMSINVSNRQFRDSHFPDHVRRVIEEIGIDPDTVRLELTETSMMEDARSAVRVMNQLEGMGVGLKIDDFGSGYPSLSNLCRLPLDSFKIDRSFISDMGEGPEGAEIVRNLVRLAAGLDLNVIAEGVETREQADLLRSLGCRYAQGFYFFRPIEATAIHDLLADRLLITPKAS